MNIAVFETQHFEGAYPMIRILDTPGNSLTVFVTDDMYRHFEILFSNDMIRFKWVVKPANMSNRFFIWEMYKHCKKNKINLLFLNTVSAHFIWYAWAALFLPSTKLILTLHDANNFLRSSFTMNLRRSIRHVGKKLMGRFCYAYSTVSETVRDNMINSMRIGKKVYCIPGAIFEKERYVQIKYERLTPIRITVAGTIDDRRRDYSQVLELLKLADKISLPLEITLAGGPYGSYGKQMLEKFVEYSRLKNNLKFYTDHELDQKSFDMALNASHFIWIPSVIKTVIEDGIEETYGLTKSSGNIFDGIKHARPMMVPQKLVMPTGLKSSVFWYDSIQCIAVFLNQITRNPDIYTNLAKEALLNSDAYTTDNIRLRLNLI